MGEIRDHSRAVDRAEWRRARLALERDVGRGIVHTPQGPRRRPASDAVLHAVEAGFHASGLAPALARRAGRFRIEEQVFAFPDLPAGFDDYTILHLSDLHVDSVPGQMEEAGFALAGHAVDLVALTGDYQNQGAPSAGRAGTAIGALLAPLSPRDGVVAVLGNHDRHTMAEALEAEGIRVLLNETVAVARGGSVLSLVGTDDPHIFYTPAAARALAAPAPGFSVALVHTPELADLAAGAGHRLYLCGHTHGGQVCLPGGRPMVTALFSHRELARGRWRRGAMHGYTSRGLGCGQMPMRIQAPAEATLIRLVRDS